MLNKIIKNDYIYNIINKIFSLMTGVLSSVFLTRYLGVIAKGEYSFIIQITGILSIILNLGVSQSYSYFYKKYKNIFFDFLSIYFFVFCFNFFCSIITFLITKNKIYLCIAIYFPSNLLNQQMESTMAIENIRLKIIVNFFNSLIKMLSFACMYFFIERNILYPIIILILINLFKILIYIYMMKIKLKFLKLKWHFYKEVIKFSWLPMLTTLLVTFNYNLDILFMKIIGEKIELGLYTTAVGLINYFWIIPDSFKEVLISKIARTESKESIKYSIKVSILLILLIILIFSIFGEKILTLMYGKEFIMVYRVTLILSLGAISMVFYKMIGAYFLMKGKRKSYFLILLGSVVLNGGFNLLMIPKWGMYGAAWSSVVSYTFCGIVFLVYFIKSEKEKIAEYIFFNKIEIKKIKSKLKRSKDVKYTNT